MCQYIEKILRCFLILYHESEMQECVDRLLSHNNLILNEHSDLLTGNFLQDQMGNKYLLFQLFYIRPKLKT